MGVLDAVIELQKMDAQNKQFDRQMQQNSMTNAIDSISKMTQLDAQRKQQDMINQISAAKAGYQIQNGQLVLDTNSPTYAKNLLDEQVKLSTINLNNARVETLSGQGQTLGNFDAKTPDEFLNSMPADKQQNIKDILAGNVDPSRLSSLRNNERERVMAASSKYAELTGQSFDPSMYQRRYETKNEFTKGKMGIALNAANTALGHLETLQSKLDALGNNQFPLANKLKNMVAGEAGQAQIAGVKPTLETVSSEMMRVYRNVGAGSEKEIEAWKDAYNPNSSPAQQKEFLKTGAELLASKIDALKENWKTGMGTYDGFPGVSPKSMNTLKNLGISTDFLGGQEGNTSSASSTIAEGSTGTYQGKSVVRKGGKWVLA
jgi:hypothetical protein